MAIKTSVQKYALVLQRNNITNTCKKPFKHLLKVRSSGNFFVETIYGLLSLFL